MPLGPGTRLGPYEILSALGAGGMGEVYRARDTRLKRDVALKILPESFATDPDRLARFQREAEVLASLNHPHIAAIYGIEESAGARALIMELVEGEDLSQRIARGPIPLDEALPIAKQIAEALEAAHEQGIIHRDLKPANVKLRPDGTVKVLDFGLAKLTEPTSAVTGNATLSPTITSPALMTGIGVLLGTAAYMAPEQAKGKPADKRSDIWAFGCVLFEMLTGKRAFAGDDVSDTLANLLKTQPDWIALRGETPASIRRLLRRSLAKDRRQRLSDASVARIEIDEAQSGPEADGIVAPMSRRQRVALWSALALVGSLAVGSMVWALRPVPPAPEVRLEITTPLSADPMSFAISPDGLKLVFVATSEGGPRLWLRLLDSIVARPLASTYGAIYPFWSPDSRTVGFFAEGKLKRVDIDGGSTQAITNAQIGRGGSWSRDGTILFAPSAEGPILRISATGGEPVAATRLRGQESSHRFPQFLPDGRHFIYYVVGSPEARGVYLGQFDGSPSRRLFDADTAAVVASSGYLLFVRQGTVFAQAFDSTRLTLTGDPFPVAQEARVDASFNLAALSASGTSAIAYRGGGESAGIQRQFVWLDRSGREIGKVGDLDSAGPINPSLSPDVSRVALQRTVNGNSDIWLLEMARGVLSRFTFDGSTEFSAVWSPEGARIVFNSNRKGQYDLYQKSATGAGNEELLLATPRLKTPMDWSSDGHFVLFRVLESKTGWDIWALPVDGGRKAFPLVQTNFEERDGQFSPDGKWFAYQSNESGRFEIYIQPFSGMEGTVGGKWQASTNGGTQVRWRRDGKELFYIALDGRLMAVPIRFASSGRAVEVGAPTPLFATRIGGAVQSNNSQQYMVSSDGQRFLMNTVTEEGTTPITVILNWKPKA